MWVHTMLFHSKFMLLALLLGKKDVSRNMPEGESASTIFFETFFSFIRKANKNTKVLRIYSVILVFFVIDFVLPV